ncbi:hypothetical protein [Derxia gummosa]|uniref:PEP-CTERM protein-sorting domain-containing protein n=1 Tax=Derxia gummosa DSM 723 TaxID=1121388 RepID=A0A8B6X803_9BURK|nr:hypothetical protein [Derxia gummosa]
MRNLIATALLAAAAAIAPAHAAQSIASGLSADSYSQSSYWNVGGATHTAQSAFNGGDWNSGNWGYGWMQVDLGSSHSLASLTMHIDQAPDGWSWRGIYVSDTPIANDWSGLTPVVSYEGYTSAWQQLSFDLGAVTGRYVEVVVHGGASWTAVGTTGVFATPVPEPGILLLGPIGLGLTGLLARRRRHAAA